MLFFVPGVAVIKELSLSLSQRKMSVEGQVRKPAGFGRNALHGSEECIDAPHV
jgi:hypothetical protein